VSAAGRRYADLGPGDPAPWFTQRSSRNPAYCFDTVAGRYVVLCFMASSTEPRSQRALQAVLAERHRFDDERACFFGVTLDPADAAPGRLTEQLPGVRFIFDFDWAVGRLYGAVPADGGPGDGPVAAHRFWLVLDPNLRVMARFGFGIGDDGGAMAVLDYLSRLPPPERSTGMETPPPVLVVPDVFDKGFCNRLVTLHDAAGGIESGFMRDVDGKTTLLHDPGHKRRRDWTVDDAALKSQVKARLARCVAPEIRKVHHFEATRVERYLVACYDAEAGGHFRPHRDNTTKGTAHRRFAVSINLNDDFDGGELSFPEYSPRGFKAPAGAAVVFSGSLLHAVSKVTAGRRYAFLPFLYDEAAAAQREANIGFLPGGSYRA